MPFRPTSCSASFTSSSLNGLMTASIFFMKPNSPIRVGAKVACYPDPSVAGTVPGPRTACGRASRSRGPFPGQSCRLFLVQQVGSAQASQGVAAGQTKPASQAAVRASDTGARSKRSLAIPLRGGQYAGFDRRNGRHRLQDLGGDLVWVALRVRAPVLEVTPVTVADEAVRDADGRAAVGNAVAEGVDRLGLVLAGQPHVIVRPVNRDVVFARRL